MTWVGVMGLAMARVTVREAAEQAVAAARVVVMGRPSQWQALMAVRMAGSPRHSPLAQTAGHRWLRAVQKAASSVHHCFRHPRSVRTAATRPAVASTGVVIQEAAARAGELMEAAAVVATVAEVSVTEAARAGEA